MLNAGPRAPSVSDSLQLYSDAQRHATWVVKVLPGLEDDKHIQACTPAIEHNIEQYLLR